MRWVLLLLALAGTCLHAADSKKKPPDVQIVELNAVRDQDQVSLDGRVRVTGLKPMKRLVIEFEFLADGNKIVSSKQLHTEEERLLPGDETSFNVQTECPPKAFQIRLKASSNDGVSLTVANPGPYPIRD